MAEPDIGDIAAVDDERGPNIECQALGTYKSL